MRRKESEPIKKHTLNLFEGDFEKLQQFHGRIGGGKVIREIVRAHIERIEASKQTPVPDMPVPKDVLKQVTAK